MRRRDFVVGAIPGSPDIYVAVTHSGVTLAAILGQYVSREILGTELIDWLAPYRPARFASSGALGRERLAPQLYRFARPAQGS